MDPFCQPCQTFHPTDDSCDQIQARRATVTPINIHQMRLDVGTPPPPVACRSCDRPTPCDDLNEIGQCVTCASTLEDLLAESLRERGLGRPHPVR